MDQNESINQVVWNSIDLELGSEQILDPETGLMKLTGNCAERAQRKAYSILAVSSLPLFGLIFVELRRQELAQNPKRAPVHMSNEERTDINTSDVYAKKDDRTEWR